MKRLLLLFIPLVFFCLPSFSQISVNEKKKSEKKEESQKTRPVLLSDRCCGDLACHKYSDEKGDDYYEFTFRNMEYTEIIDIVSFGFYDIDNAFEDFSTMCLDGFKNLPEDNYFSINLPKGELLVKYKQDIILGMYFVYIENGVSSKTHLITKNQAKKLFAKDQRFPNMLDNIVAELDKIEEQRRKENPVRNNRFDNSVEQVKQYLQKTIENRNSLEFIEWSKVQKYYDTYTVRCKYRVKNTNGVYETKDMIFNLDLEGNVIKVL